MQLILGGCKYIYKDLLKAEPLRWFYSCYIIQWSHRKSSCRMFVLITILEHLDLCNYLLLLHFVYRNHIISSFLCTKLVFNIIFMLLKELVLQKSCIMRYMALFHTIFCHFGHMTRSRDQICIYNEDQINSVGKLLTLRFWKYIHMQGFGWNVEAQMWFVAHMRNPVT